MNITLYLRVKFRAFGVTFGRFEQAWEVAITQHGGLSVVKVPRPATLPTKTILDERGVLLQVWA